MPFARPRSAPEQREYNRMLQQDYASTRRVPIAAPAAALGPDRSGLDDLEELGALHRSGTLTDDEFAAAKGRILGARDGPT